MAGSGEIIAFGQEAQVRKPFGNIMDHTQAQADNLLTRGSGVDRHFITPGELQQIGLVREVFRALQIGLQLMPIHLARVTRRRGKGSNQA